MMEDMYGLPEIPGPEGARNGSGIGNDFLSIYVTADTVHDLSARFNGSIEIGPKRVHVYNLVGMTSFEDTTAALAYARSTDPDLSDALFVNMTSVCRGDLGEIAIEARKEIIDTQLRAQGSSLSEVMGDNGSSKVILITCQDNSWYVSEALNHEGVAYDPIVLHFDVLKPAGSYASMAEPAFPTDEDMLAEIEEELEK